MRLDHLLSKEHLQRSVPRVCGCSGVVRSTPVAQTIVLRRVLTGGISANRCLAAQAGSKYGSSLERCPGTLAGMDRGVVFGTLLGPEATGPWRGRVSHLWGAGLCCGACVFLVSWLRRSCGWSLLWGLVWGVWYGVVV